MGYIVQERLCLTEDESRLVPEGHREARWLFATPGQEISATDAERFGLATEASIEAPKLAKWRLRR